MRTSPHANLVNSQVPRFLITGMRSYSTHYQTWPFYIHTFLKNYTEMHGQQNIKIFKNIRFEAVTVVSMKVVIIRTVMPFCRVDGY